ncbi:hypothetical protein ACJ5NV_11550 [Loktanella agnita]|uniref:hypothetical protein n=1 Tax=Loktanella agnita TaxID=287097 RepID=UPI0039877329
MKHANRPLLGALLFTALTLPQMASAQPCGGRYATASEMLDSTYGDYGTLYSGGEHRRTLDSVAATIDLYRLWEGVPDLRFRDVEGNYGPKPELPKYIFGRNEWDAHDVLSAGLPIIQNAQGDVPTIERRHKIAVAADLATTLGPSAGWWIAEGIDHRLSEGEKRTRAMAQENDFVDWLQMVLAASDTPWAYGWTIQGRNTVVDPMIGDMARHSRNRPDTPAWRVATAMLAEDGTEIPEELTTEVVTCGASPAGYAEWAVLRFEILRQGAALQDRDQALLPPALYRDSFMHKTRVAMASGGPLAELANLLPDDPDLAAWFNVARTYAARLLDALAAIHAGARYDPKSLRALNVLSVADLLEFANAPGIRPDLRARIHIVAFCRLIALQRWSEAEGLLPQLQDMFPDHAPQIAAITTRRWPRDVRMALIASELPEASVTLYHVDGQMTRSGDYGIWLSAQAGYSMDMMQSLRSGAFLRRDLEVWMQLPNRWSSYFTTKGYSVPFMTRAHSRVTDRRDQRRLRPVWTGRVTLPADGILSLRALDEIPFLGSQTGFTRQISESLIRWAQASRDTALLRRFEPRETMADGLRQVVLIARHHDVGQIGGVPMAQAAFALLHRKFPDSTAAAQTQYWHHCTTRCEP